MPEKISFDDMLRCIGRELKMRKRVYRRMVANGEMETHIADWEIATMQAVYDLIEEQSGRPRQADLL